MLDITTLYKFDMIIFTLHNVDYITEIYNNTTIIMIAHRTSSLKNCNKIVRLASGRITIVDNII